MALREAVIMIPERQDKGENTGVRVERAALIAAGAALILALGKLSLFVGTGSLIVALSAWDSAGDAVISFVNRFVLRYARREGDMTHPYGRGKAESIAALAQGAAIAGGAVAILVASGKRLWDDFSKSEGAPVHSWGAAIFFIAAASASFVVAWWLRREGDKHQSPALKADSLHYKTDVFSNLGSGFAIALILVSGWSWLDPVIACAFAAYTAFSGIGLVRESLADLMDRDVPDEVKREALKIIMETSESVVDVHNFRGRRSGHRILFDFHLTLPANMDFLEVHTIVEGVEEALRQRFKGDSMIHPDPDCLPLSGKEVLYGTRRDLTDEVATKTEA